jgi:hypothetical protein
LFAFVAGVILPSAADAETLLNRPELRKHLLAELADQQGGAGSPLTMHLWIGSADGQLASEPIVQALAPHLGSSSIQLIQPAQLSRGMSSWLRLSQVVVMVDVMDPHGQGRNAIGFCRQHRLEPSQALAQQTTICLSTPEHGDGLTVPSQRYEGPARLEPEEGHQPVHSLERFTNRWRAFGQDPLPIAPTATLGEQGWKTAVAVEWALKESQVLLQRSNRRLLLKAVSLALALLGIHLLLHQVTSRFLPSLLLLAAAAVVMSIQPLRQRAQQWWCLAQGIWLQDTWHRLGLNDEVAEQLPQQQRLDARRDRGQLLHLLRSHQLALALEGNPQPWGQIDLSDAIAGLERHLDQMKKAIRQRQAVQNLMLFPTLVCAALALIALLNTDTLAIERLVLVAGVALLALWLDRPLPLGKRERLERHVLTLERQIPQLKILLLGSNLNEPNLRGEIVGSFHRIGEQLLDLCNDSLEASVWNWPLQP